MICRPHTYLGALAALCVMATLCMVALLGTPATAAEQDLGSVLSGTADGFRKAERNVPINLPNDHAAHPDYRSEWWYLTGQVRDQQGREYGLQWTLFRQGIEPGERAANPWRIPQFWLAQVAVTDLATGRHLSDERLSRQGPGLAGASHGRYWLRDWALTSSGSELFPARLTLAAKPFDLALSVTSHKPAILQGDRGFSEKSEGNASFYYSYTRLGLSGTLLLDGQMRQVSGEGWFDHEWSSSVLADWQEGWDWFSLQLDDGRELMLFRLRSKAGSQQSDRRYGIVIDKNGASHLIAPDAITLSPGKRWQSPDGHHYPVQWQIHSGELQLTVTARQNDQAMHGRFAYWEGAVLVSGDATGRGYLEMTGY